MIEEKSESVHLEASRVLTQETMQFLQKLHCQFEAEINELSRQKPTLTLEEKRGFLSESENVREAPWTVSPVRADLQDRRIIIKQSAEDRDNLLSSYQGGASLLTCDFDEYLSLDKRMVAQENVKELIQRTNQVVHYPTAIMMIPRKWDAMEEHYRINGKRISAGLFDFGLYVFHNAQALQKNRSAPYVYLKGIGSYKEARLWNHIFTFTENELNLLNGTIKASILIESENSIYQSEEMLYELKQHSAGLHVLSTLDAASAHYAIYIAHKRLAHVIYEQSSESSFYDGGLNSGEQFETGTQKAVEGFDGTCVTDSNLIGMMRAIWNHYMPEPNQIWKKRQGGSLEANRSCKVNRDC
ncbi:hypothetical protein ABFG93_04260 [Pseudalkalibacillus hwajinpoensis]|uniref:hypothetical protein n=1 Tax=Guptibacillus hwajinpoensis TaxID=208199 RepID=UPI00325BD603